MAIPPEFSEIEHVQAVIRRYINKLIREDFKDLEDAAGNWEPDVTTTRGSMRHALIHKDADSLDLTLCRLHLYYFIYGKAEALQAPIYGTPIHTFDAYATYKPQITLYFRQNATDVNDNERTLEGEISFRLMHESSTTITHAETLKLAQRIRSNFVLPTKFAWHKGKTMATYTDTSKGYKLQLLVKSEVEAKRVIEQVLDIQSHTPDWKFLNITENSVPLERYPNIHKTEIILGKSRRLPKRRPSEVVHFRYASIYIWGLTQPITLVDTTYSRRKPLIH